VLYPSELRTFRRGGIRTRDRNFGSEVVVPTQQATHRNALCQCPETLSLPLCVRLACQHGERTSGEDDRYSGCWTTRAPLKHVPAYVRGLTPSPRQVTCGGPHGATLRFAVWQQGGTERRCPRPLDDSRFRGRRESNPRHPFEIGSSRALQRKLQTEELSNGNRRTGTKLQVFRQGGNRTRNLPAQNRVLYPIDVTDPSIASESSICSLRTRRNGNVGALPTELLATAQMSRWDSNPRPPAPYEK
jgi:hypothetical protein